MAEELAVEVMERVMTEEEARICADDIKSGLSDVKIRVDVIRERVYDLRHREGHTALGYKNWTQCVEKEFQYCPRHIYRLLAEARVSKNLLTNVIKSKEPDECEKVDAVNNDSPNLHNIKTMWNACSKRDQVKFLRWVNEYFPNYLAKGGNDEREKYGNGAVATR